MTLTLDFYILEVGLHLYQHVRVSLGDGSQRGETRLVRHVLLQDVSTVGHRLNVLAEGLAKFKRETNEKH